MESKSKKFTRKLIALILSVLMAGSCFTGALTAFAADSSAREYHDSNITANFMAWAEATNEQSAEALLDWVDMHAADLFEGLLGSTRIDFTVPVLNKKIAGYLDSVDGILDITNSEDVKSLLNTANGGLGKMLLADVAYVDISPLQNMTATTSGEYVVSKCGKSYRANYTAKQIVLRIAELLYRNSNTFANKNGKEGNLLGKFFRGTLSLGSLLENNVLHGTVYSLLQGALGADNGYEGNLVYNLVQSLIFNNTKWYSEADIADFKAGRKAWNYDDELFGKLSTELISEVNVLITYPNEVDTIDKETGKTIRVKDNSGLRLEKIQAYQEAHNCDYKTAASALGYDPNLVYHVASNDEGKDYSNNINIFQYGDQKLSITKNDTLFSFAYKALEIAWKTVLQPTLSLVNVNNDIDRGNGKNFDNDFYYWMYEYRGWNTANWKSNYSEANVRDWAEARYAEPQFNAASADEFLANVKNTFEYDRTVADDAKGNWQDIDQTTLFGKLRYSPLADLYFNMQTGPINLYFRQTGIKPISDFFKDEYSNYDSLLAGFNDCLVAAVELIFPNSDNIGIQGAEQDVVASNLTRPTMNKTGNTTNVDTITNTLVGNALQVIEYVANTTDANILNPYYSAKGISTVSGNLSEANLEEAMLPLLIACLNEIDMLDPVHDEKWDACKDAEGIAVVALEEYLSYVLPDKTYTSLWSYDADGKIEASFDGTLVPMARDALGFIICPIVPCRTKNGQAWNVYTAPVNDPTTIFDLLNSVVVNYAGTDTFADGTHGKGVASLLGMVDKNGNCLVKMSNTLWENLDIIVNRFLPVIGQLQYGTAAYQGKASSEDLIYNKIIKGFLDIGPNNGISTFLKQFLTICTSDPIANKGIDYVVYDDVLAPVLNGLFGARYEGQGYDKVIPYSSYYDSDPYSTTSSASPFDSLVQVDTIGKYSAQNDKDDGNQTGVIGILICNLFEALGGGNYGTSAKAGVDACWDAIGFALSAVNSFVPSFVPQLGEHKLNASTAEFDVPAESGLTAGRAFTSKTLYVENNSIGLNNYYRTADGTVVRDPRYFIKIKDIIVTDKNGNTANNITVGGLPNNGIVAPEKKAKISVTGTTQDGTNTYTVKVLYDIFLGEGTAPAQTTANTLESGLEATTYLSLSTDKAWKDIVYNGSGDFVVETMTDSTYVADVKGGSSNNLEAFLPKHSIVTLSDLDSLSKQVFDLKNNSGAVIFGAVVGGSDYSADGLFAYPYAGDQYYTVNGTTVSSTLTTDSGSGHDTWGYAAIDANGSILNYKRVDISEDGETWDRGEKSADKLTYDKKEFTTKNMYKGYDPTDASIQGKLTRPHVAWTFDEALAAGVVKGVNRVPAEYNSNGTVKSYLYKSVIIEANTVYLAGDTINSGENAISWSAGTPGLYFATSKVTVGAKSQHPYPFIAYDSNIALSVMDYNINVSLYTTNNNNMKTATHVYICDDTSTAALRKAYNSISDEMAPYRYEDFSDESVFDSLKDAFSTAVGELARPITLNNASSFGSTMISQAKRVEVGRKLGDVAYKPIMSSENLPAKILEGATKGADGYWYYNTECTMPIYSNVALTAADVTNGKDAVGQAVELSAEDGLYHLVNTQAYSQKWTKPAGVATPFKTDDTTKPKKNTYREISFVYRNADGEKVTSKDNWTYKFAETETIIKPYDGKDYRNIAAQQSDNLNYWADRCRAVVKADIADEIVNKIAKSREGLNNVNFDVASYENIVKAAKRAESLVTTEAVVDEETGEPVLDEDGKPKYTIKTTASSLQVKELVRLHELQFSERVYSRGYLGDKLEKEILCATNYPYTALSETHVTEEVEVPAVTDEETGEVVTPATTEEKTTYTVSGAANQAAEYGAYNADGTLVNEGEIVYTEESWNNYINALGEAIEMATAQEAKVSRVYDVKKNLQIAENNLEEAKAADSITVSGTVMIATNTTGSNYSVGIRGINILVDGAVVATSTDDGTFSVELPVGTTELTFAGNSTIDRTVTIAGDADVTGAIVPVAVCDYNHDGKINAADNITYFASYGAEYNVGTEYNVYCDFNGDGKVNASDNVVYFAFYGQTVNYGALQLQ